MLPPLVQFAPLVLLAVAALGALRPGLRPGAFPRACEGAALAALVLAAAGALQLLAFGPRASSLGGGVLLFSLRLDALSATMATLVAFIGWVVVRYARSYLDGEAREGRFHGLLLATLAMVMLLVQAGSVAVLVASFALVGLGLRQLLLFYPGRPEARRAAVKFAVVWGRAMPPSCSPASCSGSPTARRTSPPFRPRPQAGFRSPPTPRWRCSSLPRR